MNSDEVKLANDDTGFIRLRELGRTGELQRELAGLGDGILNRAQTNRASRLTPATGL